MKQPPHIDQCAYIDLSPEKKAEVDHYWLHHDDDVRIPLEEVPSLPPDAEEVETLVQGHRVYTSGPHRWRFGPDGKLNRYVEHGGLDEDRVLLRSYRP